ncbi:MAG: hypothetical protein ACRDSK_31170 [Actinophytocola sp.]|uniref:hypothetical protein n=1 Tax=Actinophytocola sp. TaxID=1872138 RepID=UPI003D6B0F7B
MITVLLLGALLVLAILVVGIYLLFVRPDPPGEAGEPHPGSTSTAAPGSTAPQEETGAGSTSAPERTADNSDDLESAARDYVDAVNGRNEAAATALTCERANPGTLYSVTEGRAVRLGRVEVLEGAVGSAQVRVGEGETALLLEKRENGWCVAI